MAQKFVINDGRLILGQVEMHEELVRGLDYGKTVGGGRWQVDKETNTIYFYGSSVDFGKVTKEQFEDAYKQPSVETMNIVFSEKEYFGDVMKEQNQKKNE